MIAGVVILTILPAVVFINDIKFSKSDFTEEWIKASVTLFFAYLLVSYLAIKSQSDERRRTFRVVLSQNFVAPLEDLVSAIDSLLQLNDDHHVDWRTEQTNVLRCWRVVRKLLEASPSQVLPDDVQVRLIVITILSTIELKRNDAVIYELQNTPSLMNVNVSEIRRLRDQLLSVSERLQEVILTLQ